MPLGNQCHSHLNIYFLCQCVHFSCFLDHLSDGNEWNPDIISGVVRPPEQIKLVHGIEAIRSVSSSSSSSGKRYLPCMQHLHLLHRIYDKKLLIVMVALWEPKWLSAWCYGFKIKDKWFESQGSLCCAIVSDTLILHSNSL